MIQSTVTLTDTTAETTINIINTKTLSTTATITTTTTANYTTPVNTIINHTSYTTTMRVFRKFIGQKAETDIIQHTCNIESRLVNVQMIISRMVSRQKRCFNCHIQVGSRAFFEKRGMGTVTDNTCTWSLINFAGVEI